MITRMPEGDINIRGKIRRSVMGSIYMGSILKEVEIADI